MPLSHDTSLKVASSQINLTYSTPCVPPHLSPSSAQRQPSAPLSLSKLSTLRIQQKDVLRSSSSEGLVLLPLFLVSSPLIHKCSHTCTACLTSSPSVFLLGPASAIRVVFSSTSGGLASLLPFCGIALGNLGKA